jgi:23S rRNA (uracil1939-C5)-methyltransferase
MTEAADVVTLTVDAMAHGGAAFGRGPDGRVVFVDGALPGETVAARLTDTHERFAHAVLADLPDAPSPDRIARPRCAHFGAWPERGRHPERACGGCNWGHVAYPAQLAYKHAVLGDTLRRIGGIDDPPVGEALGMDDPWAYRNRIDVHAGAGGLGFVAADDVAVVPIEVCHIAHPSLLDLLAAVDPGLPPGTRLTLRTGVNTGDRMIVIHALDDRREEIDEIAVEIDASVALAGGGGRTECVAGRRFLFERLGGHLFAIPPDGFFQVNTAMAEHLVEVVRAAVPDGTGVLVDAYSGVGTFAVLLADRAREVFAVESDPAAVQAAIGNAEGFDHLTLVEADATEGLAWVHDHVDVVVLDPPRGGLEKSMVALLADRAPATIIYVSCEPSTLARDARQLVRAGYGLRDSRIVDMFPHTHHIESVNVFRRTVEGGTT